MPSVNGGPAISTTTNVTAVTSPSASPANFVAQDATGGLSVGAQQVLTGGQLAAPQLGGRRSRTLKKGQAGRMVVFGNQQGGGGSNSPVGTNWTTALQMELEAPFVAVRIWVANADTSAVMTQTKVGVAVQAVAGTFGTAANIDTSQGDGFITATFDGQGSAYSGNTTPNAVPAAIAANRPSWKATDWIGIKSLARTDGGTRPLLQVRVETVWIASNYNLTVPYINGAGWQDGVTAGGRLYRRFAQNVNGVSTPANFTSTAAENSKFSTVIVEYALANGAGVQHMICGDSISEGAGASDSWYGYAERAVYELSTPAAPREYVNCAEHSQTSTTYSTYATDMLSIVQPDVIHYPFYSVNDVSTDITTGVIRGQRSNFGRVQAAALTYKAAMLLPYGLPCNAAFKSYTNDSRRRTQNTTDIAGLASGQAASQAIDISTPYSANVDGNDQTQIVTGLTSDNVHPNDVGHDILKVPLKAAIQLLP